MPAQRRDVVADGGARLGDDAAGGHRKALAGSVGGLGGGELLGVDLALDDGLLFFLFFLFGEE